MRYSGGLRPTAIAGAPSGRVTVAPVWAFLWWQGSGAEADDGKPACARNTPQNGRYSRRGSEGNGTGTRARSAEPLQDRRAYRDRRLVAGLPRPGHRPQPRGRDQGPRSRGRRRWQDPRDVRQGGARARAALASEHRRRLRRGRGRRRPVHRDGAPARRLAEAADRARRGAAGPGPPPPPAPRGEQPPGPPPRRAPAPPTPA